MLPVKRESAIKILIQTVQIELSNVAQSEKTVEHNDSAKYFTLLAKKLNSALKLLDSEEEFIDYPVAKFGEEEVTKS